MQIVGEWFRCDDGVVRPTLSLAAYGHDGNRRRDRFLIDSGADRTVLSAFFAQRLQLYGEPPPAGSGLQGIGGRSTFTVVR